MMDDQLLNQARRDLARAWEKYGSSAEFDAAVGEVTAALLDRAPEQNAAVVYEAVQAILHSIGAVSDDDMRGFV